MDIFSVSNNASLNPNKIAIICDDQVLSFSQIHQQVNLLKEHILENYSHIKHVGIFLDKGLEFLISFLAVIELNKVAVLLDPNWSSNQFNTIIDKYQLSLLITHDTLIKLNQLPSPKNFYSTLSLSFVNLSSKKQQYDFDDALLTPMLIGFTSGTTNLPKGFVLCQETWQKSFIMSTKCFGINTNDTIVAPGPLIHGLTLYPVIESLFNGTTAIVCSRFNTNFLNKILSQHEEICMTVPPTILMKFIEECNNLPYQSVKKIIVAGTKVDEKLILDSKKFFPAADIIDYYGASEIGFMAFTRQRLCP